jgi:probable rRNA maturation factor
MIKIYVKKQSNYPISAKRIKDGLRTLLEEKGIVSNTEVTVALVGKKKMLDIGEQYLKDKKVHDVLSFPASEAKEKFVFPPDGVIRLGEILVCYPRVFEEAQKEGKLIEEKVLELVKHGALHLLGIHHE